MYLKRLGNKLFVMFFKASCLFFFLRLNLRLNLESLQMMWYSTQDDSVIPQCPLTRYFWNSTSLARTVTRLKDKQLNSWNTGPGWGCQCFPLLESNGIEQRLALWGFMVMWYTMLPWNLPMHVLALSDSKEEVNGNYADLCPSLSYSALWVKSPRW